MKAFYFLTLALCASLSHAKQVQEFCRDTEQAIGRASALVVDMNTAASKIQERDKRVELFDRARSMEEYLDKNIQRWHLLGCAQILYGK